MVGNIQITPDESFGITKNVKLSLKEGLENLESLSLLKPLKSAQANFEFFEDKTEKNELFNGVNAYVLQATIHCLMETTANRAQIKKEQKLEKDLDDFEKIFANEDEIHYISHQILGGYRKEIEKKQKELEKEGIHFCLICGEETSFDEIECRHCREVTGNIKCPKCENDLDICEPLKIYPCCPKCLAQTSCIFPTEDMDENFLLKIEETRILDFLNTTLRGQRMLLRFERREDLFYLLDSKK